MGTFPITAVVLEQKRQFYNRGAKVNKDRLNFFFSISVLIYPYQLTPHCEVFFFPFNSNQVFGSLYSLFFHLANTFEYMSEKLIAFNLFISEDIIPG